MLCFRVPQIDSGRVFYAGKNVFPSNAQIQSLEGKFQHDISEIPIELEEFLTLGESFEMVRAGDEHFALLNGKRDKLFGWGFNSHHQLATIDSYKVFREPDVFFETEDGEAIKFMECGKLSTCVVTGNINRIRAPMGSSIDFCSLPQSTTTCTSLDDSAL